MTAIVVLGMHRSGTSAIAGMIRASGAASAGRAVRNWDNARGHQEMLALVRLNEAVLAHSGGHYLSPPPEVRWTVEHAAERDRLLSTPIDGRPPLLKDPRMLLVLPFWRASAIPFRAIGVVRHPLAVARSLEAWRELPIADGLALWTAHNRALANDRAAHAYQIIDFERPKEDVVASVIAFVTLAADRAADGDSIVDIERSQDAAAVDAVAAGVRVRIAAAYQPSLVHHDATGDVDVEALALYRELANRIDLENDDASADDDAELTSSAFPRQQLAAFTAALGSDGALVHVRAALASIDDAAAVLVPVITSLVRAGAFAHARSILDEAAPRVELGLLELLRGKVALAAGDPAAVAHLEAACAVAEPYFQARHLLPQALRASGRRDEARTALARVAGEALYPHGPLSTLAEWSHLDGKHERAIAELADAIAAAPLHRRGRLRTRRAEWLIARGQPDAARAELERAIAEDPAYPRSREVLAGLTGSR